MIFQEFDRESFVTSYTYIKLPRVEYPTNISREIHVIVILDMKSYLLSGGGHV